MIVLDACTIISFGNAGRLDLVDALRLERVCVSVRAQSEVVRGTARASMEASIAAGRLGVEAIDVENPAEQEALQLYDARPAFRGRGDAEVLALAATRGYIVASDERAIRSAVLAAWGPHRLAGTADFIVWAVREGRLLIDHAESTLAQLDSGPRILAQLRREGRELKDLVATTDP
jgi:predicted nucleic acid-binding protein